MFYNVLSAPDKMKEMLKASDGQRKVPVIVEGGNVTVGYQGGS